MNIVAIIIAFPWIVLSILCFVVGVREIRRASANRKGPSA